MRRFIINIIIFSASFIMLLLLFFFIGKYGIETISYYKLPSETKYVVFGHSHPECAYNDSLIDNFANFANSGEAYFYTFLKARKLIPNNKQIEVVFIEYSNDQITKKMDNWIWDDIYLPIRLPTYLPLMDYSELGLLTDNNPDMFQSQIIKALLKNIFHNYKTIVYKNNCLRNNMRFGGYFFQTKSVVDSLILSPDIKMENNNNRGISQTNIRYLEETIRLCKEYGKQVILTRTPVHDDWEELNSEEEYKYILSTRLANVEYVDFSNYELKNFQFYDFTHMNSFGANEFSKWFNKLLSNGFIDATEKQSFVDKEIKARTHNSGIANKGF